MGSASSTAPSVVYAAPPLLGAQSVMAAIAGARQPSPSQALSPSRSRSSSTTATPSSPYCPSPQLSKLHVSTKTELESANSELHLQQQQQHQQPPLHPSQSLSQSLSQSPLQRLHQCTMTVEGHRGRVVAVLVTRRGAVISVGEDAIKVWNPAKSFECEVQLCSGLSLVRAAVLLDQTRLCLAGIASHFNLEILNLTEGGFREASYYVDYLCEDDDSCGGSRDDVIYALAVLHDGRICCGCGDGSVRIVGDKSGESEQSLCCVPSPSQNLSEFHNVINNVYVLRDGRVCSGSSSGIISVWNVSSRRVKDYSFPHVLGERRVSLNSILALTQLKDSKLCTAGSDASIRIWILTSTSATCWREIISANLFSCIHCLTQTKSGLLVVGSDSNDGSIVTLWDTTVSHCESILVGHNGSVNGVAEMVDGSLCSVSDDKTVKIWSLLSTNDW